MTSPKVAPRHPSSQKFHNLLDELAFMHDQKMADYGTDTDPFDNVRQSALEYDVPPWVGARIRGKDKSNRIKNFYRRKKVDNEPIRDSLLDEAAYALIALILLEEETKGDGFHES